MFCNKCGIAVEKNVRRCPSCGHLLKINKNELSFEEVNDKGFQGEFNSRYETDEYSSIVGNDENSSAVAEGVNKSRTADGIKNSYIENIKRTHETERGDDDIHELYSNFRYKYELEEYRKNKTRYTVDKPKLTIAIAFILFFISPILAITYVLIVSASNKTNGKK